MIDEHPLPWLAPLLNGVEHANFFETRATEYSKGATRGDWNTVWTSFDSRKKAKSSEDAAPAGNPENDGDDLFAKAGIAAEYRRNRPSPTAEGVGGGVGGRGESVVA